MLLALSSHSPLVPLARALPAATPALAAPLYAATRLLPSIRALSTLQQARADERAAARILETVARAATRARGAKAPIPTATRLFIDGAPTDSVSGRTFDTIDPRSAQPICAVAEAGKADVDAAVRAADRAFRRGPWPRMSAAERGALLRRFADALDAHADEIAALETLDGGKIFSCVREADVPLSAALLRAFSGASWTHGTALRAPDTSPRVPVGVVAAIIPTCRPLLMGMWEVAPLLAAGNTAVLRAPRQAPLSLLRVAELAAEAGVPPGVLNVLAGPDASTSTALAAHPLVNKVAYDSLSAKSAAIVCEDADVAQAAEETVRAALSSHGKLCATDSRVFVHEKVYDEFVARAAERAAHVHVGDPFDARTGQGPIVSSSGLRLAQRQVRAGCAEGARLVAGGEVLGGVGYFMRPAVFAEVRDHMTIARAASAGPVLCVLKHSTDEEAVARAADARFTLAAGVWTSSAARASSFARALRTGAVWVKPSAELPLGCDLSTGRADAALEQYTAPSGGGADGPAAAPS